MNSAWRLLGNAPTRIASALAAGLLLTAGANAQVVINELAYDSSPNASRFAEYIELYNAGASAVNIGDWSVASIELADNFLFFEDFIPSGTMLAAGEYYVLGATGTPNLDQDLGNSLDLWPNANTVIELRNGPTTIVDAIAYEANKGNANLTAAQIAEVGAGWWGNTQNYDRPDHPISIGRYIDGRDTNNSGADFGIVPTTPGASNGLLMTGAYSIPDVDGLSAASNDPVPGMSGSFTVPRVVDPTVVDTINPNAIPASPQGGNAIMAWDESGGGNMSFAPELITSYDMYAYIDTVPYGGGGAESTTYGIGTTGSLHNLPDPTGLFFGDVGTANGNTGIGWVIQKEDSASLNRVMLVDFNDGGPSNPASGDWTVLESIEMGEMASDWYRLSLDYDPVTGDVVAVFGDQTFTHTATTDMIGTFYIGYRESVDQSLVQIRPPTFDMIGEASGLAGDFTGDGLVDAADYVFWRDDNGATLTPGDYAVWASNYGAMAAPGPSAAAAPEPTALLLAALVGVGFVCRRS
ncbi:hypothetical protein Pla123a_39070 [Posidoniimonas polymericola]|uniref:LTD domain-containing protein n=2 Tax=Posidoniimonas polymericola TaxID=2528002 RepID=A0A5C5YGC3_9BACT|nr:hypothetical protein Pla123a_39070 [Posidoniimonas polymericola]